MRYPISSSKPLNCCTLQLKMPSKVLPVSYGPELESEVNKSALTLRTLLCRVAAPGGNGLDNVRKRFARPAHFLRHISEIRETVVHRQRGLLVVSRGRSP